MGILTSRMDRYKFDLKYVNGPGNVSDCTSLCPVDNKPEVDDN